MTTTPTVAEPTAALEQLHNHQRQIDQDGTFVGVSRQALDEVLTYVAALRTPTDHGELIEALVNGTGRCHAIANAFTDASLEREALVQAAAAMYEAATALSARPDAWRSQGQAEGFAAAVAWLRNRSAINPRADNWQFTDALADQMEQSRIAYTNLTEGA